MGEIGARLADVLVVTDDNPRTEDPAAIRAAVLAGTRRRSRAPRCSRSATAGRRSAGPSAMAGPGDTVVIAGKGHETGQEIAGHRAPLRRPRRAARRARASGGGDPADASARSPRIVGGRVVDADPDLVVDRPGVPRQPRPGAGRTVRRLRRRARRRARLRRGCRRGRRGRRARHRGPPAYRRWSSPTSRPRCRSWPGGCWRRLRRTHPSGLAGRRDHRLAGQDDAPRTCWPGCSPTPRPRSPRPARSTTSSACR